MPNLATALKAEIARIARKELRADLDALKKASAGYRREIAVGSPGTELEFAL